MARTITVGAPRPQGRLGRAVAAVKRFFGIGRGITVPLPGRGAAARGKAGAGGGSG